MPCEAGAAHVYYALIVAAAEHQLQVLALLYKFAVNQRVYKAEQGEGESRSRSSVQPV